MPFMFGGIWLVWMLWSLLPVIALIVALRALRATGRELPHEGQGERLAALDAQLRDLAIEVRALAARVEAIEERRQAEPTVEPSGSSAPTVPDAPSAPQPAPVIPPPLSPPVQAAPPPPPPPRASSDQSRSAMSLEQRIGARWTTWVGVVAILFGASFFLRWAFERELIGPALRVSLGVIAGTLLLAAGLALSGRRDVPYLSQGF